MALRLFLVTAVAALGLSLPTSDRVQVWRQSTQSWVNARLAEWDARMPEDEGAFVVIVEPPSTLANSIGTVSSAPANPVPPSAATQPSPAPAEPTAPVASQVGPLPSSIDDLIAGLDLPTAPVALDEPKPAETAVDPKAQDSALNAALADVLASFANDLAAAPKIEPQPEPATERVDVAENLEPEFDYALNLEAEGLNLAAEAAIAAQEIEQPSTTEFAHELEPGIEEVYSEDLEDLYAPPTSTDAEQPSAEPSKAPQCHPDNGLGQAVRLTRDAFSAWARILHGPALVILSH